MGLSNVAHSSVFKLVKFKVFVWYFVGTLDFAEFDNHLFRNIKDNRVVNSK